MFSLSSTGQRPYSTTLFAAGASVPVHEKGNPSGFAIQPARYSFSFTVCSRPYQAERLFACKMPGRGWSEVLREFSKLHRIRPSKKHRSGSLDRRQRSSKFPSRPIRIGGSKWGAAPDSRSGL